MFISFIFGLLVFNKYLGEWMNEWFLIEISIFNVFGKVVME